MSNSTEAEPLPSVSPVAARRQTWAQAEGSPLPLGATWIEEEQAFNFALVAEHADSVTLLLYSASDLVRPVLSFRFDHLHNKSGRIWHCRIPVAQISEARYYAYSVSGRSDSSLHSFDSQKVLLDPYAQGIYFPTSFDRQAAAREGSNAGKAPLGCSMPIGHPLIGLETANRVLSPMPSSMNCT